MKAGHYLLLFLISLIVLGTVSAFQTTPGYMDAEYYFVQGREIVQGNGLVENFIWNYLDDPDGIPQPAFAYWMPLTSWLAVPGMWLTGSTSFSAARIGFLIVGALIAPLSAALAMRWFPSAGLLSSSADGKRRLQAGMLAGLLAVFSGFYLPFLPTSDSFGVYMLLGGLILLCLPDWQRARSIPLRLLLCGLLAGLMHLARADGLLWILGMALLVLWDIAHTRRVWRDWQSLLWLGLGYLLVMGPWMWRNLVVWGSPLSAGGSLSLWINSYNELFIYPAETLSFERWWAQGWQALLSVRLWALAINAQRALAEQGLIFLLPLIILGVWYLRRERFLRWVLLGWGLTFFVMTFVFPYQGARGGYFHSGAAFQPLFWAFVPLGLEGVIAWGARRRNWQVRQMRIFLSGMLVGLAALLSGFLVYQQVIGGDRFGQTWDAPAQKYARIEQYLQLQGVEPDERVMTVNPPGYYLAAGRAAIATPDTDLASLMLVMHRYHTRYLILEPHHPDALAGLYEKPEVEGIGLVYWGEVGDTLIFRLERDLP